LRRSKKLEPKSTHTQRTESRIEVEARKKKPESHKGAEFKLGSEQRKKIEPEQVNPR
jgi:hypothetical protein